MCATVCGYTRRVRLSIFVCLALLALTLGACRRKKVEPKITIRTEESTVLPRRAVGATPPVMLTTRALEVNTRPRRYLLVVPVAAASEPLPLVLVLHGDGGDGDSFHKALPFEKASGNGAILAYPDGIDSAWDLDDAPPQNRDLAFLERIIDDVNQVHRIDRAQVYAFGYSSGGFLANFFACYRPSLVRGVSSSAGGAPYGLAERWPNRFPKCPNQAPVASIQLHGDDDHGVTLDSGRFAAQYWAYVNGCDESAMETTGYGECATYTHCKPEKAVAFCHVPGLGHWVWEKAAEASWTFFATQRGSVP